MPTYDLQFTFGAPNDGANPSLSLATIEAETDGGAIAEAWRQVQATPDLVLYYAVLKSPEGFILWSLRGPEAAEESVGLI